MSQAENIETGEMTGLIIMQDKVRKKIRQLHPQSAVRQEGRKTEHRELQTFIPYCESSAK
jgi:hypothetical protein